MTNNNVEGLSFLAKEDEDLCDSFLFVASQLTLWSECESAETGIDGTLDLCCRDHC